MSAQPQGTMHFHVFRFSQLVDPTTLFLRYFRSRKLLVRLISHINHVTLKLCGLARFFATPHLRASQINSDSAAANVKPAHREPGVGMGIESRLQLRTGSKLSDPLQSYASEVISSFYRCRHVFLTIVHSKKLI